MNIRVTRFTPRYKYIRDERNFDKHAITNDIKQLPLSIVYSTRDPEMQLEMLNTLLRECIDRHAPLKRTKVTRPPAPWLKELDIQKLQQDFRNMRTEARKEKSDSIWNYFREKRNQLKAMIGKAKRNFYYKALSSVKAKDVWRVIHRILHPNPQPLRFDPDELNTHFASTAERVTGATLTSANVISDLIQSLPVSTGLGFYAEACLMSSSTQEIKITLFMWPTWDPFYERLVLGQMSDFVSSGPDSFLKDTVSAYRKGHSTTTSLLAIKDDITKAMKRGEVTLVVLADFSKAFDTVAYEVVFKKLHHLGFSKSFLMWVTSYLTGRKQFVQIDDKSSRLADYADDTTFYAHAKPCDISDCERCLQLALDRLSSWSGECNLTLNPKKTKTMLFSTAQMAHRHKLVERQVQLTVDGQSLERPPEQVNEEMNNIRHSKALKNLVNPSSSVKEKKQGLAQKGEGSPFLQVDLGSEKFVTKVSTQGDTFYGWVTKYKLKALKGGSWSWYRNSLDEIRYFDGNYDRNTVVSHHLLPSVQTRYIRIYPVKVNIDNYGGLRVDFFGCPIVECGSIENPCFLKCKFYCDNKGDIIVKAGAEGYATIFSN
ncbi:uncharacterized protein LOC125562941 [Nematostella vectensis]|uniref:uncharacterized protein LOC125562941 n=1 Tax=Nematostella vectensis TaxID=45351 RepID=UPI0020776ECF|nr:uncharacterized protein LOC125562941 [Nematostella vectensis]